MSAYTHTPVDDLLTITTVLKDLQSPAGAVADRFGYAVASLDDLDNDGLRDIAVSAPGLSVDGSPEIGGAVYIFSAKTGSVLASITGQRVGFGTTLASTGDLDGDGFGDLIIGSPQHRGASDPPGTDAGRVAVFSPRTGTQIWSITGGPGDRLGAAIASIRDVNADGKTDVLVGAPGADLLRGKVMVLSGADASVIREFTGEAAGDEFGSAVISTLDFGAPGRLPPNAETTIAIGAPFSDGIGANAGRVYLYRPLDGTLIATLNGEVAAQEFGSALGVIGPTGDGLRVMVGAPGTTMGMVFLFDLAGTRDPRTFAGSGVDRYGSSISFAGDIDRDGVNDVAIGVPGNDPNAGQARTDWISGGSLANSDTVSHMTSVAAQSSYLIGVGDQNGDGFDDFAAFRIKDGVSTVTAVNSAAVGGLIQLSGVSDNLRYTWANGPEDSGHVSINGVVKRLSELGGFTLRKPGTLISEPQSEIDSINNDGVILFHNTGQPGVFVWRDGVVSEIQSLVTSVVGAPAPEWAKLRGVKVGNGGQILLTENPNVPGPPTAHDRVWVYDTGVLTFAFVGRGVDINASGQVAGSTEAGILIRWKSTSNDTEVLAEGRGALDIDDDGSVLGTDASGAASVWDAAGVRTTVIEAPPTTFGTKTWVRGSRSNDGQMVLILHESGPHFSQHRAYVGDAASGFQWLRTRIFGEQDAEVDEFFSSAVLAMTADGRIAIKDGVLVPIADDVPWMFDLDYATKASSDGSLMAGISVLGDIIVLKRTDSGWDGHRVENIATLTAQGAPPQQNDRYIDVFPYVDPRDGEAYAIVLTNTSTRLALPSGGLMYLPAGESTTAITDHAALIETADGRIAIAGTDATGDLVIYFQTGAFPSGAVQNWNASNLTKNHIEARGQTFSPVAGDLVGLTTSWNANHFAYLDDAGEVQVVWWAPGMDLWRTDNLSRLAAAPALSGSLVAHVTPWGGMSITGSDSAGEFTALWWAPGRPSWTADELVPGTDPAIDRTNLASIVTPWGGMSVVGVDDGGSLESSWWAPGRAEWTNEPIVIKNLPVGTTFVGPISAGVSSRGVLSIFGTNAGGFAFEARFDPASGEGWVYEVITPLRTLV